MRPMTNPMECSLAGNNMNLLDPRFGTQRRHALGWLLMHPDFAI